jgi:valyl-tRNA synthetase
LATLSELAFSSARLDPSGGAIRSSSQFDLRIAHGAGVDKDAELARLKKEVERLAKDIESKKNRLADDTFRQKAPAEIVRGIETTLAERRVEHQKLIERLAQLE